MPKDPRSVFTVGKVRNCFTVFEYKLFCLPCSRYSLSFTPEDPLISRLQLQVNLKFIEYTSVSLYTRHSTLSWSSMRLLVRISATAGKRLLRQTVGTNANVSRSLINTHNSRGTSGKTPSVQYGHVMLHTSESSRVKQEGEVHMTRDPLAVHMYFKGLGDYTRADLQVVYPIFYHQRMRELGVVKTRSLKKLLRYREEIHEAGKIGRRPRATKPTSLLDLGTECDL